MDWVTVLFIVAGVLLIASEALHLSLIPVFLGAAALVVAGLRGAGLIDSMTMSLLVWSLVSVGLALPLRPLARRYLKAGDAKVDPSNEDRDAMGVEVEVVEQISDVSDDGRVRFQGTTWSARSTEGTIPAGARARLVYKDKLVWIVEPLAALDDINRIPAFDAQASSLASSQVSSESLAPEHVSEPAKKSR